MINKIKDLIKLHFENQTSLLRSNKEIEWAHILKDSIKGYPEIQKLSIFPGRWAANYSFFYILFRILNEIKPQGIIELGLGETSKFISTFNEYYNKHAYHLIIEHDKNWMEKFSLSFNLYSNSKIRLMSIINKNVYGFNYSGYDGVEQIDVENILLFIVDGPYGSKNFSRYDIFNLIINKKNGDPFIIIIDDYNRPGEKETVLKLESHFNSNRIKFVKSVYSGVKDQIVLASLNFDFITSL